MRDMRVSLELSGLWVIATPDPPVTDDDLAVVLTELAVAYEIRAHLGVCFPVKHLARVATAPPNVVWRPRPELAPLLDLVRHRPEEPATLTTGRTALVLEYSNDHHVREELTPAQASAFVALGIPFVATAPAWDRLDAVVRLPDVIARASLHLDGYLEIETTRPQLVEASPLPGLFRIDATRFGLPRAMSEQLIHQAGFVVDPLPPPETIPPHPLGSGIELSEHAAAEIDQLVESLAFTGARAIVWESGLGRRVMALAAIERLDAWPALIVTPASGLWAWQRHLDMLGHSYSLGPSAADVELTTYHQLARRGSTPSVLAIVFDAPSCPAARDTSMSLRRLASRRDAIRLAIESSWPQDVDEQIAIMELLRPGEFRSDVPISLRYPPDSTLHACQHIGAYLSQRRLADSPSPFRRSSTRVVELSEAQRVALDDAAAHLLDAHPTTALATLLDLVTAGPGHAVSPKITTALALADSPGATVVVTRSRRAATLLRNLVRPRPAVIVEPGDSVPPPAPERLTVVRVDHEWPSLRAYDHVIVIDYPFSFVTLDQAVGPSSQPGPSTTVVHAAQSLDDRLAVLATRRALDSGIVAAAAPPTLAEIAFLFDVEPID